MQVRQLWYNKNVSLYGLNLFYALLYKPYFKDPAGSR